MTGLGRHLAVIALGLLLSNIIPTAATGLQPGDAVPEFTLPDIDGRKVTLSDYRGKIVLVAFWPDSEMELPSRFGVNALPMNIAIGRDGRVLHAEPNFYRGSREKLFNAVFPDEPCLRCNAPLIQYLSH